jgi:PAS domain S-box-containing protein
MSGFNPAELARTLFEESGDALFLFEPDSERMLDVNLMAQRLSGFARADLLRVLVSDLFRSEDPDGLQRLSRAYRDSDPFLSQEGFWVRHRDDGVWVPVNLTVTRLHAESGTLGLITARDIRERRRTEEALRTSEAKYRSLLENLEQSVFLKDNRLRIIAANRRFCEAVGRPESEILGKTDYTFYPPALAEKYRADDRRVLIEGQRLELEEQNLQKGRMRRVRVIKTPVRDSQDNIVGVLGIFWDITEQHALEEQLRQAQKMEAVGQLAGGVAHDFNNLLTAILGNLALLQAGLSADDRYRPLVDASEKAAWRAANLTTQLLGFSRRTLLHPEPLSANQIVNEVAGLLGRTIDPRITLQTAKADDLWLVQADPNQMSQVLMNLCLNARDAVMPLLEGNLARSPNEALHREEDVGIGAWEEGAFFDRLPERPTILLETGNVELHPEEVRERAQARPGEFVRLRVCDNGTGIAHEAQAHIFEPFFTTKGPGKGTGLGLAMVFGIIQQHQGWIECHSIPGRGTRFDIYLPRLDAPVPAEDIPHVSHQPTGGHETILLVDDEPLVRNLGHTILEDLGYRVLLGNDGQDALDIYLRERQRIDLIILDLTMPRLSGRDTLRRLLEINSEVRVLFASGYTAEHITEEDHKQVFGFVNKPYRPEDLALAVRTALDRRRPVRTPLPGSNREDRPGQACCVYRDGLPQSP